MSLLAVWWWLRSPNYNNNNNFQTVGTDGSGRITLPVTVLVCGPDFANIHGQM